MCSLESPFQHLGRVALEPLLCPVVAFLLLSKIVEPIAGILTVPGGIQPRWVCIGIAILTVTRYILKVAVRAFVRPVAGATIWIPVRSFPLGTTATNNYTPTSWLMFPLATIGWHWIWNFCHPTARYGAAV